MIKKIFALRDQKIETFNQPIFLHTQGEAIRTLTDETKNAQSLFNKHATDFDLYELGTYDDQNASFTLHPQPLLVINIGSLVTE